MTIATNMSRPSGTMPRRRVLGRLRWRALPVLIALLIAGCRSAEEQAGGYEALYDRLMLVKAYPAAATAIKRSVGYKEDEPRTWLKLARVEAMLEQVPVAANAYQRALDLQPDNVEALANLTALAVRQRNFAGAKTYLDPLLLLDPNNISGLFASGTIALAEKRVADASAAAAKIIALSPDGLEGYVLQARILAAGGKRDAASGLLKKQFEGRVLDTNRLTTLLLLYQEFGDRAGIQAVALKLSQVEPDEPRYALEAVRAHLAQGRKDAAQALLTSIGTRFRTSPTVMAQAALLWRQIEPPERARRTIADLMAAATPPVKLALGNVLMDMGDAATALPLLRPLAPDTVTSGNVDGQVEYAHALLLAGQNAAARAKAESVLAFDDNNTGALLTRARVSLAARQYAPAINDAERAFQQDGSEEAALLVARAQAAAGNDLFAATAFGVARERFPDSIAVVRAWTDWLLAQKRGAEATAIASSMTRAHTRSAAAWRLYAAVCEAAKDKSCLADASAGLHGVS